jgi:hypothetical protein
VSLIDTSGTKDHSGPNKLRHGSIRFVSLVSILLATNLSALSRAIPSERERFEAPSSFSVFNPVKPQRLEKTYYPITPALLRSSEGLAGRMAANAFGEFWPDLKQYFFHKRNQAAQQRLKNAE